MQVENTSQSKQFLPEDLLDVTGDRNPFTDGLRQKVYFSDEGRAQRLNLMLHLAPYGGAMLLCGEKGVGKTALLHQFFGRLGDSCLAISLDASFAQSAELILQRIQEKVFWQSRLHEDTLTSLRRFLVQQRNQGKMLVLAIDNAHELDDAALNMLSGLVVADDSREKQITLVLAGEQVLKERLAGEKFQSLHSQLVHGVDLVPFSEEETAAYIVHRLNVAGEQEALKSSLYKSVYASSLGVPARINEFARIAWNKKHGVAVQKNVPKAASRLPANFKFLLTGLAVAVLLGLMIGNNQGWFGVSEISGIDVLPVMVEADDAPLVANTVQLAESPKLMKKNVLEEVDVAAPIIIAAQQTQPLIATGDSESAERIETEVDQALKPSADLNTSEAVQFLTDKPSEQGVASEFGLLQKPQTHSQQKIAALDDSNANTAEVIESGGLTLGEAVPGEISSGGISPENVGSIKPGSKEINTQVAPPHQSVSAQPAAIIVKPDEGRIEGAWLMAQKADDYTLQLMAMDEVAVRRFVAKYKLDDARYFWTMAGGKDVLAVVTGVFQSRDEALLASKALEKRIPGIKPWARTFASVQSAFKDFQSQSQARQRLALYAEHESQLLELDPNSFTLQLMAMEEHKVLSFVDRNSLGEDARYFRTESNNKPLLALVFGVYKSRVDAQQSAAALQGRLPGVTPWLRTLASIQQIIDSRSVSKK